MEEIVSGARTVEPAYHSRMCSLSTCFVPLAVLFLPASSMLLLLDGYTRSHDIISHVRAGQEIPKNLPRFSQEISAKHPCSGGIGICVSSQ